MDLKLQDKVIIVTGGMSGIGGGISRCLANEGAIPVILDKKPLTQDMSDSMSHGEFVFRNHEIDLNDTSRIRGIVESTVQEFGAIHGVVNNAGVNDNKSLEDTDWVDFEKSIHGNLTHVYELVRQTEEYLKCSQGSILNIGSKTALTGQGKTSAYAAAKGAMLALTREWAAALAPSGVRVNTIVVAEAWTPLYEKWIQSFGAETAQKERLEEITSRIPLGHRMTTIDEIADTAAFLLSPRSSHTTGQWVHVDGGYVHLDRIL